MTNQPTGQLQQANDALLLISINVTAQDRQEAMKRYSGHTVSHYLRGNGRNLDTALYLLKLFSGRISEREKELAALKES